jgi:hypothetical protein
MAIAYLQEFEIKDGDTSTTNYDAVVAALNLQDAPDGLLIHTAGFDHDAGVFRIFDVWETREQGEKFINERLNPIIEPMATAAAQNPDADFAPPNRETWYELHHSMTG